MEETSRKCWWCGSDTSNKPKVKGNAVLAVNLGRLLVERGVAEEDLARLVEVTPRTVRLWLDVKSVPSDRLLRQIAVLLEVSVAKLKRPNSDSKIGDRVWCFPGETVKPVEAVVKSIQITIDRNGRKIVYCLQTADQDVHTGPKGVFVTLNDAEIVGNQRTEKAREQAWQQFRL